MAVFTDLSDRDTDALLAQYDLGPRVALRGIASGIENSNFFLDTAGASHVLTVFERLDAQSLPFYLGLMRHLAAAGLPVPAPCLTRGGALFTLVHGKPAAIVARMAGAAVMTPAAVHCRQVGALLARMHLAALDCPDRQPNPRGLPWWRSTLAALDGHLAPGQQQLAAQELAHQEAVAVDPRLRKLPSGPVHADLFRDNVLFDGDRIGGVIDFYFAGVDSWLFDLAVTVNDWCVDLADGAFDASRAQALLDAYHGVRPLTPDEHALWPSMLRAAALRFWLSRLYDLHLPRPAAMLEPHDPARFEKTLRRRAALQWTPWPGTAPP
jgi:homoserine kinase type II